MFKASQITNQPFNISSTSCNNPQSLTEKISVASVTASCTVVTIPIQSQSPRNRTTISRVCPTWPHCKFQTVHRVPLFIIVDSGHIILPGTTIGHSQSSKHASRYSPTRHPSPSSTQCSIVLSPSTRPDMRSVPKSRNRRAFGSMDFTD